jgi:hypothetical protein
VAVGSGCDAKERFNSASTDFYARGIAVLFDEVSNPIASVTNANLPDIDGAGHCGKIPYLAQKSL